jgi:TonB-dependent SusC/RagA subfamily outer membrane receptor
MSIGAGSTEPLVLVDGAETTDISGLNPHDVKSVEVLKDAAASSIYGSRAACGVILITTKR